MYAKRNDSVQVYIRGSSFQDNDAGILCCWRAGAGQGGARVAGLSGQAPSGMPSAVDLSIETGKIGGGIAATEDLTLGKEGLKEAPDSLAASTATCSTQSLFFTLWQRGAVYFAA